MAHGRFPSDGSKLNPPWKKDHMQGFEEAMKDALKGWQASQDQDVGVTFQVTVSPNPGGIKEYRVTVGGGP
jgi:hypothetical protein